MIISSESDLCITTDYALPNNTPPQIKQQQHNNNNMRCEMSHLVHLVQVPVPLCAASLQLTGHVLQVRLYLLNQDLPLLQLCPGGL